MIYKNKIGRRKLLKLSLLMVLVFLSINAMCQIKSVYSSNQIKWFVNPSLVANNDFDWNIYNVYSAKRNIVDQKRNSMLLAADYKFYLFPDKIKVGALLSRSTYTGLPISDFEFAGTVSYQKRMPNSSVSFGAQLGFVQIQIDSDELLFPDQYNHLTGGYDGLVVSKEPLSVNNVNYFDAAIGVAYDVKILNFKSTAGLSLFHINRPDVSIAETPENKPIELLFHLNSKHVFNNFKIIPEYYFQASNLFLENRVGGIFGINNYRLSVPVKSVSVASYISVRNSNYPDLVLTQLGIRFYKIKLLFNYDFSLGINNSSLKNYRVFELGIVFNGFDSRPTKLIIPCEVF